MHLILGSIMLLFLHFNLETAQANIENCIIKNVAASTMPVRKPKDNRLTPNTITNASVKECTKSFTECATIFGCGVTVLKLKPTGKLC